MPTRLRIGFLATSDKWIDPEVVAAVQPAAGLLESLGHHVEASGRRPYRPGPSLPGDGGGRERRHRCSMARPSSATPIRAGATRGRRRSATEYIRATEQMFRRSRDIIVATMRLGLPADADGHAYAAAARPLPRRHRTGCRRRPRLHPFHLPIQHLRPAGISLPLGLVERTACRSACSSSAILRRSPAIIALAAQIERAAPWPPATPQSPSSARRGEFPSPRRSRYDAAEPRPLIRLRSSGLSWWPAATPFLIGGSGGGVGTPERFLEAARRALSRDRLADRAHRCPPGRLRRLG